MPGPGTGPRPGGLETLVYGVRRWPIRRYAAHTCTELKKTKLHSTGWHKKGGTFEKPNKNWRNPTTTKIYWQKLNHYYLPFKIWSMITKMARMSVAEGPCSAVLPTVHGCHYAFKNFPFFWVTLYNCELFHPPRKGINTSPSALTFRLCRALSLNRTNWTLHRNKALNMASNEGRRSVLCGNHCHRQSLLIEHCASLRHAPTARGATQFKVLTIMFFVILFM